MTARRRAHGEGTVFYDEARGRWVALLDLGRKPDGGRDRRKRTAATKKEALALLAEMRSQVAAGLPVPDGARTVGAWLGYWLTEIRPHDVSEATVERDEGLVRVHLLPALGTRRLKDLTPEHVETLLKAKTEEGYARATVDRVRLVLRQALAEAERRGLVLRNVAAIVRTPKGHKREGRTLTPEQAGALLDAAEGDRLEALWKFSLLLGMRPGEVCGLRWDCIDLDAARLHVRQARRGRTATMHIGAPKNASSLRTLDLPGPVVDALREHRRRQAAERLAAGEGWADLDLVFPTSTGRMMDARNVRRELDRLTRWAGLGHWTPYELRHSAVSLLCAAGVPIEEVADLAGHSDTRTTMTVYRHPVRPSVSAHVEAMERLARGGAEAL